MSDLLDEESFEPSTDTNDDELENEVFDVAAGRRWDPLGEEKESDETASVASKDLVDDIPEVGTSQIKKLENEQEILTTSLQALTSHFAQVQFRLRQIVDAPAVERDGLLKKLEEFAFRGIPEVTRLDPDEHEHLFKIMERQRNRQFELIDYLKRQLCNVEKMAYESGADILPQSVLVEKQKVIIDELKNKLKLNVNEELLPQLSIDDIRLQVDTAFGEFVHPLKMQDTLVSQLKTQIVDLERFVAYLQGESVPEIKSTTKNGKCSDIAFQTYNTKTARTRKQSQSDNDGSAAGPSNSGGGGGGSSGSSSSRSQKHSETQDMSTKVSSLLLKASAVLNIFAITQLGCSSNRMQKNSLKRTPRGNHWGDLRAQLEVDVQELISLVSSIEKIKKQKNSIAEENIRKQNTPKRVYAAASDSDDDDDDNDDDDDSDYPVNANIYVESTSGSSSPVASAIMNQKNKEYIASVKAEITTLVRKNLAITLKGLMQHGLRDDNTANTSLVPFIGCMLPFSQSHHRRDEASDERNNQQMHVWELILEYYHIKNGDQFNETPARKLSESFNLDIMGMASQTSSNKHTMLTAIGSIIAIHAPYKRSYNSHFKAFISAGLNARKLTQWLNLIYQCPDLIEQYYSDWSYVAHTGFRDALRTIDRLSQYDFDLPVDLAIRQFKSIKDVFM